MISWYLEFKRLTVPATDFDDMKVFALNLDNPKSQTYSTRVYDAIN